MPNKVSLQLFIVNCFQDSKRLQLHESLEAETIKNSVIRRKLEHYPKKLAAEVKGMKLIGTVMMM